MKTWLAIALLGCSMAAMAQTATGTVASCQAGKDCDPPEFVLRYDSAVCYPSVIEVHDQSPVWKWIAIAELFGLVGCLYFVARRKSAQ